MIGIEMGALLKLYVNRTNRQSNKITVHEAKNDSQYRDGNVDGGKEESENPQLG